MSDGSILYDELEDAVYHFQTPKADLFAFSPREREHVESLLYEEDDDYDDEYGYDDDEYGYDDEFGYDDDDFGYDDDE